MSNRENRASLRDKYKGKPAVKKGMAEGYDSNMLDLTRIFAKSGEVVTLQHIARCWKLYGISSTSDVVDLRVLSDYSRKCSVRRSW